MIESVPLASVHRWLAASDELALLDVRESGQFGDGHLFAAIPLPYSRLELDIGRLVPNPDVRVVLCDDGDGIAARAAMRLAGMGYANVSVLEGGPAAWRASGAPLFEGVYTMSKTFGELVEQARHTPRIAPLELHRRLSAGEDLIVVDGRPWSEYRKMSIPGSVCCPNGELALRIGTLVPDPATTIIVNCAGRTRSIIGAQTLIELGIPNPVLALENGTQGWFLAGLTLDHGAARRYPETFPPPSAMDELRSRTQALMTRRGVPRVSSETVNGWLAERGRTTYVLDIRTPEETAARSLAHAVHAPGGQLLQATDQWIGVRGARVVLLDTDGVRAGVIGAWLRQMGHDAYVAEAGAEERIEPPLASPRARWEPLPRRRYSSVAGRRRLLDLRSSTAYRRGHAPHAQWTIRPRISQAVSDATAVGIICNDPAMAALAAIDIREAGVGDVVAVDDAPESETSAGDPSDAASIDFVFFAHARHDGDRAAAEQYLRWETNLLNQLTHSERELFPLLAAD